MRYVIGICLLGVFAGCSSGTEGPRLYGVTGTVLLDGQPLPSGDLLLRATDPKIKTYHARIESDGSFRLQVEPGEKMVEISSMQVVPGKSGGSASLGEESDYREEKIPARYNATTELRITVEPEDSKNHFDFDLKS